VARVSAILGETLDAESTLLDVARLAVVWLADGCAIDIIDAGSTRRTAHPPRLSEEGVSRVLDGLVPSVLRSGEPVVAQAAPTDAIASTAERACRELGLGWLVCVPLERSGQSLGAITLLSASPGPPPPLSLIQDLGRRTAAAVGNMRAHQVAIVAHDLKNPLSAILIRCSMLLRSQYRELNPPDRQHVESMSGATSRMRRLVDDLLDVAALDAAQLRIVAEPTNVAAIVGSALDVLTPVAAMKGVELCNAVPDFFVAHADAGRIEQVLWNLVGNAIRFTPDGGVVAVTAELVGDRVAVSVMDTGAGISDEDLPHVFERFWRPEGPAAAGTGLGLSIARGIVEAHGGRIWAESQLGRGATFVFTLTVCS
jgi:signal transduction histidine kinase